MNFSGSTGAHPCQASKVNELFLAAQGRIRANSAAGNNSFTF
jgi:hypothetical protein